MMQSYKTINEYISMYPKEVQVILKEIKKIVNELVPKAEETISYGIPTFRLNGYNLVHFAAYKHHIGFYPTSSGISVFKEELKEYETSKGTVQFSLDKPIPYALIKKIVKYRIKENLAIK